MYWWWADYILKTKLLSRCSFVATHSSHRTDWTKQTQLPTNFYNMSHFASIDTVAPRNALNFFAVTGKLKTLKRTGWIDNGNIFEIIDINWGFICVSIHLIYAEVNLPESVADHMYRSVFSQLDCKALNNARICSECPCWCSWSRIPLSTKTDSLKFVWFTTWLKQKLVILLLMLESAKKIRENSKKYCWLWHCS